MNKSQFISSVAESTGLSKLNVGKVLEATLDTICESIAKGEDVVFLKFGTFKRVQRSAKTSRNPQTGQLMQVPAKNVPVFRAGKQLKDAAESGSVEKPAVGKNKSSSETGF